MHKNTNTFLKNEVGFMRVGIGIDTGGTYTDVVIYDFSQKKVLSSAKALTTKEDLSIGIGNALDGLPSDMLKKAEIISLSTTLATNACVENKGGRGKLLFIGVDKKVVADVGKKYGLPEVEEIYFLDGKGSFDGEIAEEPDWETFIINSKDWLKDADAVGIVEIYAMKSNAIMEKKAKELIIEKYDIPVICGHELFSDLNSIQRGSSTLLNSRLIPIIADFLISIKTALQNRDISAPVVIVRSDGTLMSEKFTGVRPVETLLCGPAASIMGGIELSNEKDSLIIDMGGTTTDIAFVKGGTPVRAEDGVNVGKWRTFVKGVYIDTFGLGGDSAVRFDKNSKMVIEPYRLIPLSIAAYKWPHITVKLQELINTKEKHTLLLHEFFSLVKDISDNPNYTEKEKAFCKAIKNGPLIFSDAAEAIGTDIYNLKVERLEKEGIVMRCGLTSTDIMHIKGDFNRYNSEAAKLGAEFVAACIGVQTHTLSDMVYDRVKQTLYFNIVRMLLEDKYPYFKKNSHGTGLETLIYESWEMTKSEGKQDFLNFGFSTPAILVGIGAPIHIFLPDVAKALGTKCIVPENAGVANALGAVVGNIAATCEIEVKPEYTVTGITGYIVYGKSQNSYCTDKDEAVEIALNEAKTAAKDEAIQRGALGDITVTSQVIMDNCETSDKTEIFLGIKVIATAVGRITL
jgi:N-methylhydantoinase A/oxoprolinase/acetone carboxylase beta subunit